MRNQEVVENAVISTAQWPNYIENQTIVDNQYTPFTSFEKIDLRKTILSFFEHAVASAVFTLERRQTARNYLFFNSKDIRTQISGKAGRITSSFKKSILGVEPKSQTNL